MKRGGVPRSPFIAIACVCAAAGVSAQVLPAGGEFRVNTYTTGRQFFPDVAALPGGEFVVVWENRLGGQFDTFGQRFARNGARLGAEFAATTPAPSSFPHVDADASGRFVVAWTRIGGVYLQRFDAAGSPVGSAFAANSISTGASSDVAMAPDGRFVVAWSGANTGNANSYVRRFRADGVPVGSEVRVNTYVTGDQQLPRATIAADGRFVVTWYSSGGDDGNQYGVFAQRFAADGTRLGANFQVNTYTTGSQKFARIAGDPAGNFVIVWFDEAADGSGYGLRGQRFASSGARVGAEFTVNTYTTGHQGAGEVAMADDGAFTVAWSAPGQDGSQYGIYGQHFLPSGAPQGAEFRVNTYTTGSQYIGSVARDPAGNLVVTWISNGQDGSDFGVYGQSYGGLLPLALRVDVAGNAILEPGETSSMRPTWRNVDGVTHAFGGTISGVGGPPGGVPTFPGPTSDYGAVAPGGQAECLSCFTVSVPDPIPRPVLHWDAVATEAITPAAHGYLKPWTLHVGRSFTDVLPTHPHYPHVEAIVHRGMTGGCQWSTAGSFCPEAAVTREQIAPLLLVAKEGNGYVPPACTGQVFKDVKIGDPFCAWIEELTRRGVVTGCSPAEYYCPADPVAREQIALLALRTLDPSLNPPPCVPPNVYADVPETSPFCRWIEELAARGVVSDCGGGNYCPAAPTSREQMAYFLAATFALAIYAP